MKKFLLLFVVIILCGCSNKNILSDSVKVETNEIISNKIEAETNENNNNLKKKKNFEEETYNDWTLNTSYGEEFTLSKCEKPVFINFWATWCPPCVGEMPDLAKIYEEYKDKVDFIFVNCGDSEQEIKKCIDDMKIDVPVGYDFDNKVDAMYQVTAIPTTIVYDKNKRLFTKIVGARSEADYRNMLEELLKLE